jgi:hypothetical protein
MKGTAQVFRGRETMITVITTGIPCLDPEKHKYYPEKPSLRGGMPGRFLTMMCRIPGNPDIPLERTIDNTGCDYLSPNLSHPSGHPLPGTGEHSGKKTNIGRQ